MKAGTLVTLFSFLVAVLGFMAATLGLVWPSGLPVSDTTTTSVHGETVTLLGNGLYRFDALFIGAGFLGQDVITLIIAVPALLLTSWRARSKGRIYWLVFRLAVTAFFAYIYGTMALGAAYNELFLLYAATLSAALFSLVLSARELHARLFAIWPLVAQSLPRNASATLLLICGSFTGLIWALPLIAGLIGGTPPPYLFHATTKVTEALDLAIIVPSSGLAAVLILQNRLDGYVLSIPLFGLLALLFPTITASTISQLRAGVTFSPPEIIGPIGGFLVFGVLAALVLWRIIIPMAAADATE